VAGFSGIGIGIGAAIWPELPSARLDFADQGCGGWWVDS